MTVSRWSFSGRKYPWVTGIIFRILTDLNNVVVCLVSTCPHISILPVALPILQRLFKVNQIQLVSPSLPCLFVFSSRVLLGIYLCFHFLLIFTLKPAWTAKSIIPQVLIFLVDSLVIWPRLGDLFVSQNPRKFCTSHSPGQSFGCAYTINRLIGLVGTVFASDPGDLGSIPGRVIPKTLRMVLDTSLLNTQHYKVGSWVKWGNPGKGVALSPTPRCSSYWKGSLLVALD